MAAETICLTLGIEELHFLLKLLRADTLPGLPVAPPPEQEAAGLIAAERSLQARGLLQINESERRAEIDAVAMALIGTCLIPCLSILVISQRAGQASQTRYYHVGADLTVEHTASVLGLHTFIAAAGPEDFAAPLIRILNLPQCAGRADLAGCIRQETLMQTREQALSADCEIVTASLLTAGLDHKTASALAATLHQPALSVSFTRLSQTDEGRAAVDGFALLEGMDIMWAFSPEPLDRQWLRIEAIATDEAKKKIEMIMRLPR